MSYIHPLDTLDMHFQTRSQKRLKQRIIEYLRDRRATPGPNTCWFYREFLGAELQHGPEPFDMMRRLSRMSLLVDRQTYTYTPARLAEVATALTVIYGEQRCDWNQTGNKVNRRNIKMAMYVLKFAMKDCSNQVLPVASVLNI